MTAIALSDVRRTLLAGWQWWLSELKALVPTKLAAYQHRAARADVHILNRSVEIARVIGTNGERLAEDRPIENFDDTHWQELESLVAGLQTRIILARPDVYATTIRLPRAAARNLKSAVALQLGQIAPVDPALLSWQTRIIGSTKAQIDVRILMAKTHRVEALQALFDAHGIGAFEIHGADGEDIVRLAAVRSTAHTAQPSPDRRASIIAALLLASIPFTIWLGASVITSTTEARIKTVQQEVAPRLAIERRAQKVEALRRALAPIAALPSISDTVEDLATRLPETAHLTSLAQQGDRKLRLVVDADDPEVLEAPLSESSLLPDIHIADQTVGADQRMLVSLETSAR